jgi:NhaA family Na+:H+ antiporter
MSWGWFACALLGLGVIFAMRRGDVQSLAPYMMVGAFVWLSRAQINAIERAYYDRIITGAEFSEGEQRIDEVARLAMYSTSPIERLERRLSPWVAYVVVPVFALANAGVTFTGDAIRGIVTEPVTLGVMLGLVLGKTIGVFGATVAAIKLGIGRLPTGANWRHMFGLAITAGVGFTVALFVTSISFDDPAITDQAKVGILVGSTLAGILGYSVLRAVASPATAEAVDPGPAPAGVDADTDAVPAPV